MDQKEVPRIPADELKDKLDRGEELIVLDVRSPESYDSSDVRISGSIRKDPTKVSEWVRDLDPGREYVTY
ncbi:MAG: hypothetical protein M1548_10775 [Actinobacteria bacterium]|nr:hypothetical protein [Actinomycetota bacterium]